MIARFIEWLRRLFLLGSQLPVEPEPDPEPEAPARPRHNLTRKQWLHRKVRLKMARESRQKNRN